MEKHFKFVGGPFDNKEMTIEDFEYLRDTTLNNKECVYFQYNSAAKSGQNEHKSLMIHDSVYLKSKPSGQI